MSQGVQDQQAPGPDDDSVGELFSRLVDDGRSYAQAEIGYYRTLARAKLLNARTSLWMGAVALGLAQAAAVALVVGLVFMLAPLVGPALATLIVVVCIGGLAALMARLAWVRVKKIMDHTP